jgi:small conductance mechanosensitive channel
MLTASVGIPSVQVSAQEATEEPAADVLAPAVTATRGDSSSLSDAVTNPAISLEELGIRLMPLTRDELAALAEVWRNIVKGKTRETMEDQLAVTAADGAAADVASERLIEHAEELSDIFDRYSAVIDAWDLKGGDEAAIEGFRTYRLAVQAGQIRSADAETLLVVTVEWLISADGGVGVAKDIAIIVASLFGLLLIARIVRGIASNRIHRAGNISKLLQSFLVTVIYWLVLSFGLLIVLSFLGVDVTPLIALVGGITFIIGFAFQETLGNFASGLMILISRPFDEGDFVNLSGVEGIVKSVNIVATTVVSLDNEVIVVPNRQVFGNVITNVTASDTRRVDLTFGIGYGDDIPLAISVLKEAVEAHPLVLKTPEPLIVVKELGDSSVNFLCAPWTKTENYWTVYWDLMANVKQRFDAAGISIPFPQRDVHLHTVPVIK